MESKKSPHADLEKKRGMFLELGLIIVLGIVLIAFEWSSSEGGTIDLGTVNFEAEEEMIPVTRQEEVKPPPPPPPQVTEILNIVEDDVEIEEELEIEDMEADEQMEVEIVEVVEEVEEEDEIFNFYVLEDKPTFPLGGEAGLLKWIAENTKYPEIAKENGISGRVFVGFVIDKQGKVTDVNVLRGVDPYLDKEAVRVVKSMPNWKPGKQRGKPVKVQFQVPINFKLR